MNNDFFVRFWGVRGSIACPGSRTVRYGGNTACLEIRCGERLLIFDAGTGLHFLGNYLVKQKPVTTDIFITHTHLDHINGFPFFKPAYREGNRLTIWGGMTPENRGIQEVFRHFMQAPLFPVPLEFMRAQLCFRDFQAGETIPLAADIQLRTVPLNHPGGATGYRIEYQGRSICYVADTEHYPDRPDADILALIDGADIVIYDAQFTDAEYPAYQGWGHSTWREGVRLATAAGAPTFVAFHHAPDHDDEDLDEIAAELYQVGELRAIVAREGMALYLRNDHPISQ